MSGMRARGAIATLACAWLVAAGCAESPPAAEPPAATDSSTGAGARDGTERRGNTPPGMDRSGGGPAEGTIKDPSGAATGTPDRR